MIIYTFIITVLVFQILWFQFPYEKIINSVVATVSYIWTSLISSINPHIWFCATCYNSAFLLPIAVLSKVNSSQVASWPWWVVNHVKIWPYNELTLWWADRYSTWLILMTGPNWKTQLWLGLGLALGLGLWSTLQ